MKIVNRWQMKLMWAAVFAACSTTGVAQSLSDALSNGEALALSAGVSGQVARVLVKPGENVEQGQLLLSLGATTYQSRLDATRAVQAHAQFNLQLIEEDFARQQELYEEGSLSAVELQQLELQVKRPGCNLRLQMRRLMWRPQIWHLLK